MYLYINNQNKYYIYIVILFFIFLNNYLFAQKPSFYISKPLLQSGDKIKFINTSDESLSNEQFIWNFGDDCNNKLVYQREDCDFVIEGLKSIEHTYKSSGRYLVTLRTKGSSKLHYSEEIYVNTSKEDVNTTRSLTRGGDLITNGSFEDYSACPNNIGQINLTKVWYNPTPAASDYFNECYTPPAVYNWSVGVPNNFAGTSFAQDGVGYVGILTYLMEDTFMAVTPHPASKYYNYREYIQHELAETLINGEKYIVQFYLRLSSKSRIATNIGAILSSDPISSTSPNVLSISQAVDIEFLPDSNIYSWQAVTDTIIAKGGEKYLTIGNFSDDYNSKLEDYKPDSFISSNYGSFKVYASYYYIDNVLITLFVNEFAERQVIAASGSSFKNDSFSIDYTVGQSLSLTYMDTPNIVYLTQGFQQPPESSTRSPIKINTPYILKDKNGLEISYYPNPCNDKLTLRIYNSTDQIITTQLHDFLGRKIIEQRNYIYSDEPYSVDLNNLRSGTYYVRIENENQKYANFIVVKIKY